MKQKLLIVHHTQYGYNMGSVQYCKFLKDDYDISFICWDYTKKKIAEPGITIIYISRDGNIIKRNIRFIRSTLNYIKHQTFTDVFIHYFIGASAIPLFCKNRNIVNLDIRTGSVTNNFVKRIIFNTILRIESSFFKRISIISDGLKNQLGISKRAIIFPLGANPIYVEKKIKYNIHLLYIGVLTNRKIEDTICGLRLFLDKFPLADLHYTIVGGGYFKEEDELKHLVNQLGLESHIDLVGYVPYNEIKYYYEITNVGVSYVPITSYYKYQPVTKTFEYLMAGMPVIATQTYENKLIINQYNGVLIKDQPEDFAQAIVKIYDNFNTYNENIIRKSVENYEWSQLIEFMKKTILTQTC